MHFACTQENLIQALTIVCHVAGKNINLPILGNILLKTEVGSLKLSSTNLEMAINCVLRGKVEMEGEYSVPAKLFLDYVSLLPSGKVELVLKDEGLEVRSGEQETVLKGMAASEFPLLPKVVQKNTYKLRAGDLKKSIDQVVFAASTSESRPELGGVACFFGGQSGAGKAIFAATDSYRLAEKSMTFSSGGGEARVIAPARAFLEVSRILGSYKDELGVPEEAVFSFTENQLVMNYGNVELISRLIEGSFPDYQQIIPQNFKTEAVLGRAELQKAVRTASLFSRQGLFDVHLVFDPDKGICAVQSSDQGVGRTKTMLKGAVTGVENSVTLNFRYLGDGLSAMNCEKIRFKQIDPLNPVLILPEDSSDAYRYIVMPIRQ